MRSPAWRKMSGPAPVLPDLARSFVTFGVCRALPRLLDERLLKIDVNGGGRQVLAEASGQEPGFQKRARDTGVTQKEPPNGGDVRFRIVGDRLNARLEGLDGR
jgi:hypothetical protein